MYQLIIKNTRIIDGTGSPAYRADLAVMDGKIAAIAPEIHEEAELVIDGEGLVTAPGFIDIHSHSDTYFLVDDRGESRIYQGVTSELAGAAARFIHARQKTFPGCGNLPAGKPRNTRRRPFRNF